MVKAMLKMAKPPLSLARCRSHFDSKVQECSNGFVVGNSCKIGEESGESELSGGFYASSLLKVANDWYSNEEHDLDNYRYTKNIVNAHNSAIELVKTLNDEQNPYLDRSSRSGPYFPFAVMRS
jgi:hypothetical protein